MTYTEEQYHHALEITEQYVAETLALSKIEDKTTLSTRTISKNSYLRAKLIVTTYIKQKSKAINPQMKLL